MTGQNPKVIAVDFDETIGLYRKSDNGKGYEVKKVDLLPNPEMAQMIRQWRRQGHKVIVYSSRWWGDYNALVAWFKRHKIKVDDIVLGRLKADVYICDKSVNPWTDQNELNALVEALLHQHSAWGQHEEKEK
jgi:hypothetical protein